MIVRTRMSVGVLRYEGEIEIDDGAIKGLDDDQRQDVIDHQV